ncbi:MAG: hypothetical protein ABIV39_02005 [Verrucomicrobiota bacterium]
MDPWIEIYIRAHVQVMVLETKDDVPLKKRLHKWLMAMKARNENAATHLRNEIERLRKTVDLDSPTRTKRLEETQTQLGILNSEDQIDNCPSKGWLKVTLADVKKRNVGGMRDAYLHEQ